MSMDISRYLKHAIFIIIYRKTKLIEYKIRMRCPYWYLHLNLHNTKYVFANILADVHCDTKFLASMTCVLGGTTTVYATCADEGHCMFLEVPTFLLCLFQNIRKHVVMDVDRSVVHGEFISPRMSCGTRT